MKALLRLCLVFALLACLFFTIARAEQIQHPLIEEIQPVLEPVVDDTIISDKAQEPEPVPPPIWSLCGTPSQHLLIPYFPPFAHLLFS
jgi:hypothetical protein